MIDFRRDSFGARFAPKYDQCHMEQRWPILVVALIVTGCGGGGVSSSGNGGGNPTPPPVGPTQVNSFAYQLQNVDPAQLSRSAFGLVVTDYSQDGTTAGRFTSQNVQQMQSGLCGRRPVVAYMSIGEAENYRFYWQNSWDPTNSGTPSAQAPSWLGPVNPDFAGNYKVRYWDPAWQAILFGSANSYLDQIMAAGFDGVYLDIIDAYEYWGSGGESGLNRPTAEQEMVNLVEAIAHYARITKGKSSFLIIPQNGELLSSHADYVETISAIGEEDTWFDGNTPQPASHTTEVLSNLDVFKAAGKPVLVTDYVTQTSLINSFYTLALGKGYIPYATVRNLDQLTINSGHVPTCQ